MKEKEFLRNLVNLAKKFFTLEIIILETRKSNLILFCFNLQN